MFIAIVSAKLRRDVLTMVSASWKLMNNKVRDVNWEKLVKLECEEMRITLNSLMRNVKCLE